MNIVSVEAIPLRAELSAPFRFAHITRTVSSNVVVRLTTDEGLVGWGEACPVPQLTAETQRSIVEIVDERVAPVLLGADPLHRSEWAGRILSTSHAIDFTMAAVDTALLDIAAKSAGVPLSRHLGGYATDTVEVHGSVGWDADPATVARTAATAAERFRWLKLYAGRGSLEGDLRGIEAAREEVGEAHPFLLDVNGLWSVTDVARAADRLRRAGVRLVEQPVAPTDLPGNARATRILTDGNGIDVVADESVRRPQDVVRVAHAEAASVVNVGLSKLGGVSAALRTADVARAHGLGVLVGGVVELGIANAAGLHLAACVGATSGPAYLMGPLKYARQITAPVIAPVDSTLEVPRGPGLGVEIDEEALTALDARRH
ncbi:mandelate racemase/muconate lactonizing enzyme family protein [Nocardiopsis sp. MG754419]|uniref:mandelate racemase/muconate lactonizing enzyme family protein n=1 Tax=Nocardiopsis sp. MG754419 TaxID=2259865 RepID=UPI001BA5A948|nr:enolase C-terminal domain-like protein [Nocardiopsis sp. MG754419]MBR8740777.1 hypothetical protein [Nocardiopsis sp. MG754419]